MSSFPKRGGPGREDHCQHRLRALVVLVVGAVFLIRHVIEQSELKTREKLLEIEYRLAELAETAKPGKTKD